MMEIKPSTLVWQDNNLTHLFLCSPCDAPVLPDMVVLLLQGLQVLLQLIQWLLLLYVHIVCQVVVHLK